MHHLHCNKRKSSECFTLPQFGGKRTIAIWSNFRYRIYTGSSPKDTSRSLEIQQTLHLSLVGTGVPQGSTLGPVLYTIHLLIFLRTHILCTYTDNTAVLVCDNPSLPSHIKLTHFHVTEHWKKLKQVDRNSDFPSYWFNLRDFIKKKNPFDILIHETQNPSSLNFWPCNPPFFFDSFAIH